MQDSNKPRAEYEKREVARGDNISFACTKDQIVRTIHFIWFPWRVWILFLYYRKPETMLNCSSRSISQNMRQIPKYRGVSNKLCTSVEVTVYVLWLSRLVLPNTVYLSTIFFALALHPEVHRIAPITYSWWLWLTPYITANIKESARWDLLSCINNP